MFLQTYLLQFQLIEGENGMKKITLFSLAGLSLATITTSASASLALNIDFGPMGGTKFPKQQGFEYFKDGVGVGTTTGPISQSYSGLDPLLTDGTVTVTTANGTSLTSTGTFTTRPTSITLTNSSLAAYEYCNLYMDNLIANGNTMTIGVSGLIAGMQYNVTFYAYNDSSTAATTMTFTDYSSGSADTANAKSVTWTGGYQFTTDTPSTIFATTLTVTANSSGQLVFREVGSFVVPNGSSTPSALLDGMTITAVPEPAALLFTLTPLAALLLKRRK